MAFIVLIDQIAAPVRQRWTTDGGRSVAISLFETEEDLRAGDAVLNDMSPPDDGFGSRTSVENYEVAVDVRL